MANSDASQYVLRVNEISGGLEFGSGTNWTSVTSIPHSVANVSTSSISANFGPSLLFTVPVTGMYQISYYIVNTVSGTGGDAEGQLVFNYTDASGGNTLYANMPSG